MTYPYREAKFERRGMMPRIYVSIYTSPTNCETWGYTYDEDKHKLYPRDYFRYERRTPRHKWVAVESSGCSDRRQDTLKEMPTPPDYVGEDAKAEFVNRLVVDTKR